MRRLDDIIAGVACSTIAVLCALHLACALVIAQANSSDDDMHDAASVSVGVSVVSALLD